MKNFQILLLCTISTIIFILSCKNPDSKKLEDSIETVKLVTIGDTSIEHIVIVANSSTGKGCYYVKNNNTVKKYFEKDSLSSRFILTENYKIEDLIVDEYVKDANNQSLKPILESVACGLILGLIRVPASVKILTPGCKSALCNYGACKFLDKCPLGNAENYREYACAACAEIPCEGIPIIKVKIIKINVPKVNMSN